MRLSSEQLSVGLVFVVIALLACLAPVQSDTWWQLRAGQDTWQTRAPVFQETYSHTAAGRFWPKNEWLSEVVFYAAYRAGGLGLLTAACAAAMIAAWALAWRLTKGPFELGLGLLLASIIGGAISFAVRPQAFSMLLFSLTVALLVSGRVLWLPLVVFVWANLHGAVALGLVAIGGAVIAAFVTDRRIPVKLLLIAIASAAATCLTPLGIHLWTDIPASLERSRVNALIEWLPPGFDAHLWPFWAMAVALPMLTVFRWRTADIKARTLASIAMAILPLAVRSMRNVHIFLLVGMPAIGSLVSAGRVVVAPRIVREHGLVNAVILGVAATAAAAVVALAWMAPAPRLGWRPISPAAVSAVRACGDPMYNTYGDGGTFIWFIPEKRVFIDNRQDPYPLDLLAASRATELSGDYESLFSQYRIQCAVLSPNSPVAERLRTDPGWISVYDDPQWVVFSTRKSLPPGTTLKGRLEPAPASRSH